MNTRLKIEVNYDISCAKCGRQYSTDFNHGIERNKIRINVIAKKEGWAVKDGKTLCPQCSGAITESEYYKKY